MRKMFSFLLIMVFSLVLFACGNNVNDNAEANNVDNTNVEPEEVNDESNQNDSTEASSAEEVYEKILETAQNMKSAEVEMTMEQTMAAGDEEPMNIKSSGTTSMILDPLAMHQKMTGETGTEDDMMPMDSEMYMLDDEMYMLSTGMDEWIKLETDAFGDLSEMVDQQDPQEQLEMAKSFATDFDVSEEGDTYILSLDADGEEYTEMVKEMAEEMMPSELNDEMEAQGIDLFEEMTINDVSYQISANKETYEMTDFTMKLDMIMAVQGEEIHTIQDMKMTYLNINEIDEITVPDEVKENAVSADELGQ